MRKIIPLGFKYGSGKGWKYVWHPEDPKEYYHFETLERLYRYEFSKHGVLERFGPMFCRSEIISRCRKYDKSITYCKSIL